MPWIICSLRLALGVLGRSRSQWGVNAQYLFMLVLDWIRAEIRFSLPSSHAAEEWEAVLSFILTPKRHKLFCSLTVRPPHVIACSLATFSGMDVLARRREHTASISRVSIAATAFYEAPLSLPQSCLSSTSFPSLAVGSTAAALAAVSGPGPGPGPGQRPFPSPAILQDRVCRHGAHLWSI